MIQYGAYLPEPMLDELQPLLDFAFLEPNPYPGYSEFYARYSGFKLLDNGCIERGYPLDLHSLLNYSETCGAHTIVAPDHLGDWPYNLRNAKELCKEVGPDRTACCLAGPDFSAEAAELEGIATTVLLPYRLNRHATAFGGEVIHHLHLLGLRVPEDFSTYPAGATVVSLDTCEPVSAAFQYWPYSERGFASFKRPTNYDNLNLTSTQTIIAKANIAWLKRLLHTNAKVWPTYGG